MITESTVSKLEQRVAYLSEEKRAALVALELAAELGEFQTALNTLESPQVILGDTAAKMQVMIRFRAIGFYLVDEESSDISLAYCDTPQFQQELEAEVETLIKDKVFSWTLRRSKAETLVARHSDGRVMLHALTTPARVRGMCVGLLDKEHCNVLDISFSLLTFLLHSCAGALESYELYRYISQINQGLEATVQSRTQDLQQMNDQLAREVASRRQAQEDLQRERDFTNMVLDTAGALVVVLRPDGTLLRFNRACSRITGYSIEELLTFNLADLIPDSDQQRVEQVLTQLLEQETEVVAENYWRTKTGELKYISWSNNVLHTPEGGVDLIVATGLDITDRVAAEELALRRVREWTRTFNAVPDMVMILTADHTIQQVNRALADRLRVSQELLQGRRCREALGMQEAELCSLGGKNLGTQTMTHEMEIPLLHGTFLVTTSPLIDEENEVEGVVVVLRDVTSERENQQALAQAEETYRTIFENTVEGIFRMDGSGRFMKANQAMASILGYADEQVLLIQGERFGADPVAHEGFLKLLQHLEQHGQVANFELHARRQDGAPVWVSVSATAVRGSQGNVVQMDGLVLDITERKLAELNLKREAMHDALTGLANRRMLLERFNAVQQDKRNVHAGLLYLDLDNFKPVNDTHGHHVGDMLLQKVARRLERTTRTSDTVVRLGGDEFVILLPGVTSKKDLREIGTNILQVISGAYELNDITCTVGASIGGAMYPQHGQSLDILMQNADQYMYEAKKSGKGMVLVYATGEGESCSLTDRR